MRKHNFTHLPDMLIAHTRNAKEALDLIAEHSEDIVGPAEQGRTLTDQLAIAAMFGYSAALELDLEQGGFPADIAKLMTVAVVDAVAVLDLDRITETLERMAKAMEN